MFIAAVFGKIPGPGYDYPVLPDGGQRYFAVIESQADFHFTRARGGFGQDGIVFRGAHFGDVIGKVEVDAPYLSGVYPVEHCLDADV